MGLYAVGARARAVCDICGLTCKLRTLKALVDNGAATGMKACRDCWVPDHPQNSAGKNVPVDAQALRDARPDLNAVESRNIAWGWNPVYGVSAVGELGTVDIVCNTTN